MRRAVTDFQEYKARKQRFAAVTAYEFSFAELADQAGIEMILVGDSLGNVVQGKPTTLSVTVDEILYHSQMVCRGVSRAFVVADLPFMSYQIDTAQALRSAGRLLKESDIQAIKVEGGREYRETISRLVDTGIPVLGHLGLLPQRVHAMGGYRVQGKTQQDAERILEDANILTAAGVFGIVLEGIPASLAEEVTGQVAVPTIGIGAGAGCDGQILVLHDLLGLTAAAPKFVRKFASLRESVLDAFSEYHRAVSSGSFPDRSESYE